MATIDKFNELRQAILDRILDQETTIQEAFFGEREKFDGSPAAVVGVSQNEALYNSQKTDKLTFVFNVRIYIPVTPGADDDEVEVRMGKAYWQLLNMFSLRGVLNPHADIVEPIASIWGYEERANGILRFSEINLRCVIYKSNSPYVAV